MSIYIYPTDATGTKYNKTKKDLTTTQTQEQEQEQKESITTDQP